MVNVTKAYLPPLEEYVTYLEGIWERVHLTNHGPLVNELEEKLRAYLNVKHLFFVNNGTVALQIAINALGLDGEIITTPFSYVATTSSIVWENCKPVFVDIKESDFTIDVNKIEAAITPRTRAILTTHVYGIPCDVTAIQSIAQKYGLKVIYDAAHAFGVKYDGKAILNYGDISTLSFHATKLFHTVEGGAVVTNDDAIAHRIGYMRNFGHNGQEDFWGVGINGKNSEFHAAMGLCILPRIDAIISRRRELSKIYDACFKELNVVVKRPVVNDITAYNYAYYPVVFANEQELLMVRDSLQAAGIYPRRYFYPSLNTLTYLQDRIVMQVSEDISGRVLCLPLYNDLSDDIIRQICHIIAKVLNS
jgi:dTDP-4-amino-4,6-dideoxygalactose transaminase